MIVQVVPFLNIFRQGYHWSIPFEALDVMTHDSWGYKLGCYLSNRGLKYLPKYQQHDALHVLLGYDTTPLHEIRLQAFMVGNGACSFAGGVLYRIGLILLPENKELLRSDFERGVMATRIDWLAIEREIAKPLSDIRNKWSICPVEGVNEP